MKKKIYIVIGAVILFFAVNIAIHAPQEFKKRGGPPPVAMIGLSPGGEDKFIVANPLKLPDITSLSYFRSCMGHDQSGKNINGQVETLRSMKHYVTQNTMEGLEVYAPFDGTVMDVHPSGDRGIHLWLQPESNKNFVFIFFHVDPLVQEGGKVKAGQVVGRSVVGEGKNFDIAVKKFEAFKGPTIFNSPFLHMTSDVLAEYAAVGITPENIILSKEQRDADPCPVDTSIPPVDGDVFFSSDRPHTLDEVSLVQ